MWVLNAKDMFLNILPLLAWEQNHLPAMLFDYDSCGRSFLYRDGKLFESNGLKFGGPVSQVQYVCVFYKAT
jgi:hypothetical protein